MTRLLFVVSCLLALHPTGLTAQVPRSVAAFQLVELERSGIEYRYEYRLSGRQPRGEILSDVYLEITAPKSDRRPVLLGSSGVFLFDAIAEQYERLSYSHPPLHVSSPPSWSAAIYMQGVISWGADRWAGGRNMGVSAGRDLRGFALRSPALPGWRRYTAVPYRPFGSAGVDAADEKTDSTWVLMRGYVVAPGIEAMDVTPEYLKEQLDIGCTNYFVDNCGRYLRAYDAILAAENARDDRQFAIAVGLFRRVVADDRTLQVHARIILDLTAEALTSRPPSRRRPPAAGR
jgi:hypothetical protein